MIGFLGTVNQQKLSEVYAMRHSRSNDEKTNPAEGI
jgi:hypothetical protein